MATSKDGLMAKLGRPQHWCKNPKTCRIHGPVKREPKPKAVQDEQKAGR